MWFCHCIGQQVCEGWHRRRCGWMEWEMLEIQGSAGHSRLQARLVTCMANLRRTCPPGLQAPG